MLLSMHQFKVLPLKRQEIFHKIKFSFWREHHPNRHTYYLATQ